MDKPTLTPPELRRKKAEVDGRLKAKESESSALIVDFATEGRTVTETEWAKADGLTAEILQLRKLSDAFSTQIVAAERWEAVDNALTEDRSGRLDSKEQMPHNDERNTRHGRFGYSLMKVLRNGIDPRKYPLDGIEREVHDEMNKERKLHNMREARGVQVPWDLPIDFTASMRAAKREGRSLSELREMQKLRRELAETRDLTTGLNTGAGAGSIPVVLSDTMIDILRPRMVTVSAGARLMTDMQGLFAIPRQATTSTFYMVNQGVNVTTSNPTIDQVPFAPRTGGAQNNYTRQFMEQTNQDAEMLVREDQAAVIARGVETQGLNGSGTSGAPLGILPDPQIATYALGTNGAAPSWTQIVTMEAWVASHNADVGTMSYVTDALTRGTLKTTAKIGSTFPIYLWNTESATPLNGYPCYITNLLPQNIVKGSGTSLHAMIFANWSDMIYAFWSGMDVIVDPYTQAANGGVIITTLQDFDVNKRHHESFVNCSDIISMTGPVI